jgi:hypothetical protein
LIHTTPVLDRNGDLKLTATMTKSSLQLIAAPPNHWRRADVDPDAHRGSPRERTATDYHAGPRGLAQPSVVLRRSD